MTGRCDLHTHSLCSDGTDTPRELAEKAAALGLDAVALTDHNTVAGLRAFLEAGRAVGIRCVPGAEFTTEENGAELHLVGLFLGPEAWPKVEAYTAHRNEAKKEANRLLIQRMAAAGYPVTWEGFLAHAGEGLQSRPHIAAYLVSLGFAESVSDAFHRYLEPEAGFYVPAEKLPLDATVRAIRSWGGVAVLAHPLFSLTRGELVATLDRLGDDRPDAMEAYYSTYTDDDTSFVLAEAAKRGMLVSGGSDYHGTKKENIALGVGRGSLTVPTSCFEALYALWRKRNGV